MKSQISRLSSLALVASLLGAATAYGQVPQPSQLATPAPSPVTPDSHSAATQGGKVPSGGRIAGAAAAANTANGWYYVHATHCVPYYNGSTTWVYMFPQEGGYWYTNNAVFEETFLIQCQQGYWIGIYVFNNGILELYTYDYR